MKIFFLTHMVFAILFMHVSDVCAQKRIVYKNLTDRDTANEKALVAKLWMDYLESRDIEKYWCKSEKEKYRSADLLNYSLGLDGYLYNISFDCNIIGVYQESESYIIKNLFYWHNNDSVDKRITALGICNVMAVKENGEYKLSNYLSYSTKYWFSKEIGKIVYHYPPQYPLNEQQGINANKLIDSVSKWFKLPAVDKIEYYIFPNCRMGQQLVGWDFFEGNDGRNLCGFYDSKNHIIYSNYIEGAFYAHELIHILNDHYPNANLYFNTGLAAYINDAGSMGGTIKENLFKFRLLDEKFDLERFYEIHYINEFVAPNYIFGAIICHSILRSGGLPLLRKLMNQKMSNEELKNFLLSHFRYNTMKDYFDNEGARLLQEQIILKL